MKRGQVTRGAAWALITGAGSGIGRCYAERLAALGYNLILVGQEAGPLRKAADELTAHYQVSVRPITLDLARLEAADELYTMVAAAGIEVDVLINNAGIFSFCDVLATDETRIERMLLLHDMTTTKLCRRYAARMIERGVRGHILNMSSYSLWMPFPGLAAYSASKAYIKSFSEAFAKELRKTGVTITAICPAGIATDLYGLSKGLQKFGVKSGILMSPKSCARRGLNAMFRGKRVVVPDWWYRLLIPMCMYLPGFIIRPLRNFTMKWQK